MYKRQQINSIKEEFQYIVGEDKIVVERNPGPIKTLSPEPVQLTDMQPFIKRSNDWSTSAFLREIHISGYLDSVPTTLRSNTLKQHLDTGIVEKEVTEEEKEYWATERFGIDRDIYHRAIGIYEEKMINFDQ